MTPQSEEILFWNCQLWDHPQKHLPKHRLQGVSQAPLLKVNFGIEASANPKGVTFVYTFQDCRWSQSSGQKTETVWSRWPIRVKRELPEHCKREQILGLPQMAVGLPTVCLQRLCYCWHSESRCKVSVARQISSLVLQGPESWTECARQLQMESPHQFG